MPYLNLLTNEYPRYDGDLERDFGWNNGEPLPENWVEVKIAPVPEIQFGQTYQIENPIEVDGQWVANWSVRDLTEEELTEIANRPRGIPDEY